MLSLLKPCKHYLRRAITVAVLLPTLAVAQAYRWVDAEGKTHFSDQPPAHNNTHYDTIGQTARATGNSHRTANAALIDDEFRGNSLVVAEVELPWRAGAEKKSGIGRYFFGNACASATAMVLPGALHQHRELFPQASFIGSEIAQHLREQKLSSYWDGSLDTSDPSQWPNALRLRARITDLEFDTCAPGERRTFINFKLADIPARKFRRHRLQFTVHWQLLSTQGNEIYRSSTAAYLDSWNQSLSAAEAFRDALQLASNQLLVQPDFKAALLQHKPAAMADTAAGHLAPAAAASGPWQLLQEKTSQYLGFYRQSQLGRVLAILPAIKVKLAEFYTHEGIWPGDLSQIGMHEAGLVNNTEGLQRIYLEANGGILLKLDDKFGPDARLLLKPLPDSANQMLYWRCTTNIAASIVPISMKCKQESGDG